MLYRVKKSAKCDSEQMYRQIENPQNVFSLRTRRTWLEFHKRMRTQYGSGLKPLLKNVTFREDISFYTDGVRSSYIAH